MRVPPDSKASAPSAIAIANMSAYPWVWLNVGISLVISDAILTVVLVHVNKVTALILPMHA
jgi:hypothetical protein